MSKKICNAPFTWLSATPTGYQTCCVHSRESYQYDTPEEWWNGKEMVAFRKGLLTGDMDDLCKFCYKTNAGVSPFFTHDEEKISTFKEVMPFEFDAVNLFISNKCNFACRTCSPMLSTTQAGLRDKMGVSGKEPYVKRTLDMVDIVNRVKPRRTIIAGGEVTFEPIYLDALKKIEKDIGISMITNGSAWDQEMFEEVLKFKDWTLSFSMDGGKKVNEYLRTFAKHEVILENLNKWLDLVEEREAKGISYICYTLSSVSIWGFGEFVEELFESVGERAKDLYIGFNHTAHPKKFRISNLDRALIPELMEKWKKDKEKVMKTFEKYNVTRHSQFFQQFMYGLKCAHAEVLEMGYEEGQWEELVEFNQKYDNYLRSNETLMEVIGCE